MNLADDNTDLFNEVGCLSRNTIQRYIEGKLSNEELTAVKKHVKNCSICMDAITGARYFSNGHSYKTSLGRINQSFFRRRDRAVYKTNRWSVNATVLLAVIILIIGIFYILSTKSEITLPGILDKTSSDVVTDTVDTLKYGTHSEPSQETK